MSGAQTKSGETISCCEEMLVALSADLDDELDGAEARTLARHLNDCEACRAKQKRFLQLRGQLSLLSSEADVDRGALEQLVRPQRATPDRPGAFWRAINRSRVLFSLPPFQLRLASTAFAACLFSAAALFAWLAPAKPGPTNALEATLPALSNRKDERPRTLPNPRVVRRGLAVSGVVVSSRSGLWVVTATGKRVRLTTDPSDRGLTASPDGRSIAYLRGERSQTLIVESLANRTRRVLSLPYPRLWAPRFRDDHTVRLIADGRPRSSYRSARELDVSLADSDASDAHVTKRGPHFHRVPTAWSKDRCVSAKMVPVRNALGQLTLSVSIRSCRGGWKNGRFVSSATEKIATWPQEIGNLRQLSVSPDGRYVALTIDRGAVSQTALRPTSALLYLIAVEDRPHRSAKHGYLLSAAAARASNALAMDAYHDFLTWVRLADRVVGTPRFAADSSKLCFIRDDGNQSRSAWCWRRQKRTLTRVMVATNQLREVAPAAKGPQVALLEAAKVGTRLTFAHLESGDKRRIFLPDGSLQQPPVWLAAPSVPRTSSPGRLGSTEAWSPVRPHEP
jgi:anti-sigma factor RsiW